MLEFLKQQEIIRKRDMENFPKTLQEDIEKHRKELEQQEGLWV